MAWIKRNLFFVIGGVVALILLVGAGFYTWTGWTQKAEQDEKLNQAYADLKRLMENPFVGGSSAKVDNIKLAVEQQKEIHAFLKKTERRFERIPAIPVSPSVGRDEYASALRLTIDLLQREATNNSVALTPRYNFSFEAQRRLPQFATGSLPPLAVQLGEVKAICDILNQAKINALESIRRERVSTDDDAGPQTDYLAVRSQTNDLAVLSPYEITFRCFSPELGAVVAGFANSPYGIIVKNINVEPASAQIMETPMVTPVQYQPVPVRQPVAPPPGLDRDAALDGGRYGKGFAPPPQQQPVRVATAPVASGPRGMPVMLNEKQLKVTLLVHVVKMLPKK